MFLNLGADFPVYFGTVSDISDVVGKNGVDCVRVALMRLDDCFIGRSLLIAFSLHEPPEPLQGKLDMPPCCARVRPICTPITRAAGAGNSNGKFLPVSALAKGKGGGEFRMVQNGGLAAGGKRYSSSAPARQAGQTSHSSDSQGNFPFPPPAHFKIISMAA